MEKRTCKKCGVERDLEHFPFYYNTNKAGERIVHRRFTCRPCKQGSDIANSRVRFVTPEIRHDRKVRRRYKRLESQFGITAEQYLEQLAKQAGACAICKKPCPSGRKLAVDHDHKTGEVRGLLCCNCNRGMGLFFDNSSCLREAAVYLESTDFRIPRNPQ